MEGGRIIRPVKANAEIGSGLCSSSGSGDRCGRMQRNMLNPRSTAEFCASYETSSHRRKYEKDLRKKYKLLEIKLFLKSEGRVDEANIIQSLYDDLACSVTNSWGFKRKDWILRPDMGRYDDYQRLYVGDWIFDEFGEIIGQYGHLFCTYASDKAFLEYFKELQCLITWNMSHPQAWTIAQDASKKYVDLEPETLDYAIDELLLLKKIEEHRKEAVPFYTKLWEEVVKDKRDGVEVLKEIVDKDAALYPAFKISIEDELSLHSECSDSENLRTLYILESIKDLITASTEVEDLSQNYEQLIHKYFHEVGPEAPLLSTYADYVERKMKVAEKLGLI